MKFLYRIKEYPKIAALIAAAPVIYASWHVLLALGFFCDPPAVFISDCIERWKFCQDLDRENCDAAWKHAKPGERIPKCKMICQQ